MHAVLNKIAKGISVCYSEVFPYQNDDYFNFKGCQETSYVYYFGFVKTER